MRYIGSKKDLLNNINDVVSSFSNVESIIDLFGGSGVVSEAFKKSGYKVYSNDILYFSYVLMRGTIGINKEPDFNELNLEPFSYLNSLNIKSNKFNTKDCFIYNNYSPHDNCKRMYFTTDNALKIDYIRLSIEDWYRNSKINADEYYYLLSSLISAVPFVSNIAGVYGAYLKKWDKRAFKNIEMKKPIIHKGKKCKIYNLDYKDMLKKESADILYSDSPYNSRQYLPNYHILETIAKYDNPNIKGITGIREYDEKEKSSFCNKTTALQSFETMINLAKVKYIIISYNNEGIVNTSELKNLCLRYSKPNTFNLVEIPYRRYKSKIPNNKNGLKEQLYIFEKL